jgi:hypothetical protein
MTQFQDTLFGFSPLLLQFSQFFRISNFFGLSITEETLLNSRNAHLVNQNWYRISFTETILRTKGTCTISQAVWLVWHFLGTYGATAVRLFF